MYRPVAFFILLILSLLLGSCASLQVLEFRETDRTDPLVVLQFSDLHWRDTRHLEELNSLIEKKQPDLLVFTGDLVSGPGAWKGGLDFLSQLKGEMDKYAILGNWDGTSGLTLEELKQAYGDAGFRLLVDEELLLEIRGRTIHLSGWYDSAWYLHKRPLREDSADSALRLIHEPLKVEEFATPSRPTYFLAGHTHGGQITLFGLPLLLPPGTGNYVAGRYQTPAGNLYVSKGLGGSHLDFRLFAEPDVIILKF